MMKKILPLMLSVLCAAAFAAPGEAEVHAYRQSMRQAGQELAQGQAQAAFVRIRAAAEQGFAEAQYILATLYQDGEGTPADPAQARRWYEAAAANHNPAVSQLAREALNDLPQ